MKIDRCWLIGLSTASSIAYVSYMYAVVDQKHFKRITSYVRAASLFGKFLAYGSGQLLISTHLVSYLQLHEASKYFGKLISWSNSPVNNTIVLTEKSRLNKQIN